MQRLLVLFCLLAGSIAQAQVVNYDKPASSQPYSRADRPLRYKPGRKLVTIGYSVWFGPTGMNTPNWRSAAHPYVTELSGGNYDSSNWNIIIQHFRWLEQLGVDAIMVDLSNGVKCAYNSNASACGDPIPKAARSNAAQVIWAAQHSGYGMKTIPLLGGWEANSLETDSGTGLIYLANQVEQTLNLYRQNPNAFVLMDGKPLFLFYMENNFNLNSPSPQLQRVQQLIADYEGAGLISGRLMAGYAGDMSHNNTGTMPVSGLTLFQQPVWSWWDRFRTDLYPGQIADDGHPHFYLPVVSMRNGRAEAMVATNAAPGFASGFPACWNSGYGNKYWEGNSFNAMMDLAQNVKPDFLNVNQWNGFWGGECDHGRTAEEMPELEPNDLMGYLHFVKSRERLITYKRALFDAEGRGAFDEAAYLAMYPDVRNAVQNGAFSSGWQHFDIYGRNEGRFSSFPEASYLSCNKDVLAAVDAGAYASGRDHFVNNGTWEGRSYTCGMN
jgi:hypothetical protein